MVNLCSVADNFAETGDQTSEQTADLIAAQAARRAVVPTDVLAAG